MNPVIVLACAQRLYNAFHRSGISAHTDPPRWEDLSDVDRKEWERVAEQVLFEYFRVRYNPIF